MPEQKNNVNNVRNNVVSKQHCSFLRTKQAEVIDLRLLVTHIQFPAPAPRCLRGARPVSRRSAGYNTAPGGAPSERCAAAGRKRRWGVLLRAVNEHPAGSSRPALCKCHPAAQIAILACFIEMLPGLSANISTAMLIMSHPPSRREDGL